jgi:hypothetical protein
VAAASWGPAPAPTRATGRLTRALGHQRAGQQRAEHRRALPAEALSRKEVVHLLDSRDDPETDAAIKAFMKQAFKDAAKPAAQAHAADDAGLELTTKVERKYIAAQVVETGIQVRDGHGAPIAQLSSPSRAMPGRGAGHRGAKGVAGAGGWLIRRNSNAPAYARPHGRARSARSAWRVAALLELRGCLPLSGGC